MKKNIVFFVLGAVSFVSLHNSYAAVRLTTPEDMEIEQLNKEEKAKLQNIQYTETVAIPNQYKGKLKYTEGKEEVHLKDARLFLGVGGRYTFSSDITLKSDQDINSPYFNKKNTFELDDNFNFYASAGLYWRNGIRLELEYSQMTLNTSDYGKNFARYDNGIIFNQYLQKTANLSSYTSIINGETQTYTALTDNMLPTVDLSIKTYMFNFIFEKTNIKSKLRPYIGFGVGLVEGDFTTLETNDTSRVLGGQVMVGLSYPFVEEQLVLYLGYRGIFARTMEQTFTRVVGVSLDGVPQLVSNTAFNGNVYYNPQLVESKEKFNFQAHNIDLGIRFFF